MVDYPNRTGCDILRDMRKAHEAHNYSYLPGLIEELQWVFNRGEAALEDLGDIRSFLETRSKMKARLKTIKKLVKDLKLELSPQLTKEMKETLEEEEPNFEDLFKSY